MASTPWRGAIGQRVRGSGPRDACVVLLAEAPGADEEVAGAPLVGRSGQFLFEGERGTVWGGLNALGLGREVVRCENVLEVRPLDNDLDSISLASMAKWQRECRQRLAELPQATILVPMGNCALNTVLGSPLKQRKKRGGGREWVWAQSISAWRGSTNQVELGGRGLWMVPTFHPAFFLWRDGANFAAWRADWLRIARMVSMREGEIVINPAMNHIVAPTWHQVELFEKMVQHVWHRQGTQAVLAFDIETVGPLIDCIGFCVDEQNTITVPLLPQHWPDGAADCRRAWQVVQRLVEHPIPKGTHYGHYDVWRLRRQKGWHVRRWWWDSFDMHHCLDPTDDHSLDYCASRELSVPYWKHLNKEHGGMWDRSLKAQWHQRHEYNGKDVGYTWHLIRKYQQRLQQPWEGLWSA